MPAKTGAHLKSDLLILETSGAFEAPETPQSFAGVDQRAAAYLEMWSSVLENALASEQASPELTYLCLQAPPDEAIRQILHALYRESQLDKRNSLVSLLETCLQESLGDLFKKKCRSWDRNNAQDWSQFVQVIMSLPTRVANKMQENAPKYCTPEQYSSILVFHVASTLKFLAEAEEHEVRWDIDKLCLVVDKILTNFGGCMAVESLMTGLLQGCQNNTNLQTVVRSLVNNLEGKACENALTLALFSNSIGTIVGTEVSTSIKKTLLTTLPFLRCHNDTKLPENLIKTVEECFPKSELVDLLIKLISVWSNRSAISHTSIEQQTYVSEMIVWCVRSLKREDLTDDRLVILQSHLSDGIPKHLESTSKDIRLLGMVVAERVTALLHPDTDPLKFEYDSASQLYKQLNNLTLTTNEDKVAGDWFEVLKDKLKHTKSHFTPPVVAFRSSNLESTKISQIEGNSVHILDSDDEDDEFVSFDMSNDVPLSNNKKPAYLREALQLLAESPEEVCLSDLPELIAKQLPTDDGEIAIELLDALLHLEVTSDNEVMRGKSLVATVVAHPEETTKNLCEQLTVPNKYAYSHSSCILRILALSALEVFQGKKDSENVKIEVPALPKNTRRFHAYRPPIKETRSKFAPVAGFFLYPLLPCLHCDWPAELRVQLLATLATVIACSVHAPRAKKMSLDLIEELVVASWPQSHADPQVRVSAMRSVVTALANLDVQGVFECAQRQELRLWMAKASSNDPDEECRQWAARALTLI